MANWTTPKVDYWDTPRPVGGEDFKRIEGNTQYLKEQTDGLKNGSITAGKATNATNANNADTVDGYHASEIWARVTPSNTTILSSTSHSWAPTTAYELAKQFQVRYPGRYRISFDVIGEAKVKVTLDDQTQGIEMDPAPSTVILDLPHVSWGGIITIYIARKDSSRSTAVYNCYLKGTIATSRPSNSVLVG